MTGKLFQLIDSTDGELIGLIHTSDSNFDEDTVGYHWTEFCKTNDADADDFADYISEQTGEKFDRIFVEEIYN